MAADLCDPDAGIQTPLGQEFFVVAGFKEADVGHHMYGVGKDGCDETMMMTMADGIISRLPYRYDHLFSNWFEEDEELSEGEWQRMAPARTLSSGGVNSHLRRAQQGHGPMGRGRLGVPLPCQRIKGRTAPTAWAAASIAVRSLVSRRSPMPMFSATVVL